MLPVSNKQMPLMPMANGGIGFYKYEARNLWTITSELGSIMADQNRIVVTSQISTRLWRLRQQVSSPVSSIINDRSLNKRQMSNDENWMNGRKMFRQASHCAKQTNAQTQAKQPNKQIGESAGRSSLPK